VCNCYSRTPTVNTLQVYQAMVQRGVRPSIATFGTIITAASDAGDLDAVQIVRPLLESPFWILLAQNLRNFGCIHMASVCTCAVLRHREASATKQMGLHHSF